MRWNDLFADLEAQLEFGQWQAVEQDAAELTRGLWAEITLMDRLRAALGQQVRMMLRDGRAQTLVLKAVGPTWVGGADGASALLLPREAIVSVDAELRRAVVPSKPLQAGPKMRAVYRMLARRRELSKSWHDMAIPWPRGRSTGWVTIISIWRCTPGMNSVVLRHCEVSESCRSKRSRWCGLLRWGSTMCRAKSLIGAVQCAAAVRFRCVGVVQHEAVR